ncbi:hypothetical protein RvY_05212 [Ramazzottius varieornatus]|uniref:Uncharacterized protein n=1 Tax=Ramazzottius varieornatus TaxID=947166 RepID=A0A1D1UU97_RAMVA|nr:hypothetical protein RvY_05212 [Ramazzottius varieornatus]
MDNPLRSTPTRPSSDGTVYAVVLSLLPFLSQVRYLLNQKRCSSRQSRELRYATNIDQRLDGV